MQQVDRRRWTKEETAYLVENYGKIPFEEMAKHLDRSVMAIRLRTLRGRLDVKHQVVKENRLKKLLSFRFRHLEDFTPSRYFYKETGINQMRFWDLFYGRKSITAKEYAAVADYFYITTGEAFESLQLDLFNDDK